MKQQNRNWKLLLIILLSGISLTFQSCSFNDKKSTEVDLTTFLELVENEKIKRIELEENLATATKDDGQKIKTYIEDNVGIYEQFNNAGIKVDNSKLSIKITKKNADWSWLWWIIGLFTFFGIIGNISSGKNSNSSDKKTVNDSDKETVNDSDKEKLKLSFDDIGGAKKAKEELKRLVKYLKESKPLPKGILLEGPPGTGKTELAKALANEAKVYFIQRSGSDFINLYSGIGPAAVRELFDEARKNQPAIIYIDEIDAIGFSRSLAFDQLEHIRTVAQLLDKMDGFNKEDRIVVIASTNQADLLDKALLRPGRFDKRILVDLPNFEERCEILDIHLKRTAKEKDKDINLEDIARYTIGFNGAELADIVYQAERFAEEDGQEVINQHFLEKAIKERGAIIPEVPDLEKMKDDISKQIIGQNTAIFAVARAICHHYTDIRSRSESNTKSTNKPNLFFYGSPGTGKTSIIKATAELLQVPFASMTASGLGRDISGIKKVLKRLVRNADNDVRRAQYGIVCLYGMENFIFSYPSYSQEELAKAIEDQKFELIENNNRIGASDFLISIETKDILFICEYTTSSKFQKNDAKSDKAHYEKLIALGVVPGLLNQFPLIGATEVLSEEELLAILKHKEHSPVSQFTNRCKEIGIKVEFDDDALKAIAQEAVRRGGDVRLFNNILDKIFMENLPDKISDETITITGEMIEQALPQSKSQFLVKASSSSLLNQLLPSHISEKLNNEFAFFAGILQQIEEDKVDEVYSLLKKNSNKLDDNFANFLVEIATLFENKKPKLVQNNLIKAACRELAEHIFMFGYFVYEISGENREIRLEMCINAGKISIALVTKNNSPETWANIQQFLANIYKERIRGNHAENLEIAISRCNLALEIFSPITFSKEWVNIQFVRVLIYSQYTQRGRDKNFERVIQSCESVLQWFRDHEFSNERAKILATLTVAYIFINEGDRADNFEKAIKFGKEAEKIFSEAITHESSNALNEWADNQIFLALAYSQSIQGNRLDNLEKALEKCKAVLDKYRKNTLRWAKAQMILALTFTYRVNEDRKENLEYAISSGNVALGFFNHENYPYEWAFTNLALASAYSTRMYGDREGNFEEVIKAAEESLKVFNREVFPIQWMEAQIILAYAYINRIKEDRAKNLEDAISTGETALEIIKPKEFPIQGARTQSILVVAYVRRTQGNKIDDIEKSIKNTEETLNYCSREIFPYEWSILQNSLGLAYLVRIKGEKTFNIDKAIVCFQNVINENLHHQFFTEWDLAGIQRNLALAYLTRERGNRKENFKYAKSAIEEILDIYDEESYEWAISQFVLATAYLDNISYLEGKIADNRKKVISAGEAALNVLKREKYSYEWAMIKSVFALAYTQVILGDEEEELEKSIVAGKEALEVLSCENYPYDWAKTKFFLGLACTKMNQRESTNNLQQAIAYFQESLEVLKSDTYPTDYAVVKALLGLTYERVLEFSNAYKAYKDAIDTVEFLRGEITLGSGLETDKQKLAEKWNQVYQDMVDVCLELAKEDSKYYATAIEYVERSKARSLVELVANSSPVPKGDIPQEIRNQYSNLREKIDNERQNLEIQIGIQINENITAETAQMTIPDSTELNRLQRELDQFIDEKIKEIDPEFSRIQKVQPISFEEIEALTGENTVIVEWYKTRTKYLVFIITPQSSKPEVLEYSLEKTELLDSLFSQYSDKYREGNQWEEHLSASIDNLAEALDIKSIFDHIPSNINKLILIPYRFLNFLPIHALPIGEKDKCILDKFKAGVSYIPSCQLLQQVKSQNRPHLQSLFTIQNPTEDRGIKFTELEVKNILSDFQQNKILSGKGATKEKLSQFKTELAKTHYLHLSSHGQFNNESPLDSFLLLADAYISPIPPDANTRRDIKLSGNKAIDLNKCLTLSDLFKREFDLNECRLVVLSACESGLVDFYNSSNEYIGLPSGFLYIGSTNIVSSLWSVEDLSTALLMIKFSQNLKDAINKGQDIEIDIALNQAQLWLRDITRQDLHKWANELPLDSTWKRTMKKILKKLNGRKPFRSPYFWAGFIAIGQ